jgi:CDP-paratose 2-epimerase
VVLGEGYVWVFAMRYLVTGGLGVIGSRIVCKLLSSGHSVKVVDDGHDPRHQWAKELIPGHDEYLRERMGSIDDDGELVDLYLRGAVEWAEHVVHCAASTGIPYSVTSPNDDWSRNVDGTRVLLETLRNHPKPTVVLSSVKPYKIPDNVSVCSGCNGTAGRHPSPFDDPNDKRPYGPCMTCAGGALHWTGLKEADVLVPDEPYAASKAAQSMLAMAYARSYDIPVVTFRCSNLYGPAPCHGPRHGWLTWFAISAAIGRPIEVQGTGEQTRDMLHADDVYSACMLALESADRLKGRVFNLGGGASNRISVADAASQLAAMGGVDIVHAPARAMDDLHVFANTGAFLRETGWRPLVGVQDGMRSVFEWAKANADELRALYASA